MIRQSQVNMNFKVKVKFAQQCSALSNFKLSLKTTGFCGALNFLWCAFAFLASYYKREKCIT